MVNTRLDVYCFAIIHLLKVDVASHTVEQSEILEWL
jgi:hypothetical protein